MIKTDKYTIRTIEEKDIKVIQRWNSCEFRGEYQEFRFESKQALLKQFNCDGFCSDKFQMLFIDADDSPIGLLYITFIRHGLANIGVVICDKKRRQGLGTQIIITIVDYLFNNYDLVRIQADTDINNIAAQRVLEKAGFEKEGIMRKYRYHHGQYNDSFLYSIIR